MYNDIKIVYNNYENHITACRGVHRTFASSCDFGKHKLFILYNVSMKNKYSK